MLIVALVLAVIGLAALVTAVVTSNELIAWVCIAASVIGVVLLIVDALRERSKGDASEPAAEAGREPSRSSTRTIPKKPPSRRTTESDAETTAVEQHDEVAGEDRNSRNRVRQAN